MPRLTKLFMRRTEGQFVAVFRSIFVANTRARRNNRPGDLSDYLSWKKNTCEQWVQIYADLLHDYSHSKKDIVEALEMYEDEMELFCTLGGPSKSSYVGRIWSAHHLEVCETLTSAMFIWRMGHEARASMGLLQRVAARVQAVMNCMGDCRWYRNQDGPSLELAEYPRLKRAMKLFVGGLGNGLGGMPFDELPSMLTGDPRLSWRERQAEKKGSSASKGTGEGNSHKRDGKENAASNGHRRDPINSEETGTAASSKYWFPSDCGTCYEGRSRDYGESHATAEVLQLDAPSICIYPLPGEMQVRGLHAMA